MKENGERENGMREEWRKIDTGYVVTGLEWKRWKFRRIYRAVFLFIFPQTIFVSPAVSTPSGQKFCSLGNVSDLFPWPWRGGRFCNRGCGFEKSVCHAHGSIRFPRNLLPPPSIFIEFFRFSPSSSPSIRSRIAVIHAARRYFQTDIRHADKFYQHRYPASPMTM